MWIPWKYNILETTHKPISICLIDGTSRRPNGRRLTLCNYSFPIIRSSKSIIPRRNKSNDVSVAREGSPSLILRVLLISFGITILPKLSTRRTMSVAFIYLSPFTILDSTTNPRCHCEPVRTLVWQSPSPTASLRLPRRCAPRNDIDSRYLPTIILQITLLVSVNAGRLYRKIYFFKLLCYNIQKAVISWQTLL